VKRKNIRLSFNAFDTHQKKVGIGPLVCYDEKNFTLFSGNKAFQKYAHIFQG